MAWSSARYDGPGTGSQKPAGDNTSTWYVLGMCMAASYVVCLGRHSFGISVEKTFARPAVFSDNGTALSPGQAGSASRAAAVLPPKSTWVDYQPGIW